MQEHAEAGLEGAIIGTVVGAQFGPAGAAVGAAVFGLWGLVTGEVPFDNGGGAAARGARGSPQDADAAMEREIEEELDRQRDLEREIEEELRRQEELLKEINREEELARAVRTEQEERAAQQVSDPLAAPKVPYERPIPDSIFDREIRQQGEKQLLVKTLDADRDGRPELEVVYDADSGELLSRSEDTDYDGRLDSVNTYDEIGQIAERREDTNRDGTPDRWTHYSGNRAQRVEVDRDFDGVRDGFYVYENGWRKIEEHDTNNDGSIDRRLEFKNRRRMLEAEDRDYSGKMEIRTFYDEDEIPIRAEIDSDEDGVTDTWEHYVGDDPAEIALARKEEDVNGDGSVDVTSYYEAGKLVRQEISDPDLVY